MNNEKEVLFSVSHLKKYFQVGKNATLKAVDDVSFEIYKGETLGMVGESGCGKTTCGRTCIGLYSRTDGEVLFKGKDPQKLTGKEKQNYKKSVQMVFQDPYGSLDPRMTVAEIIGEGIDIHHLAKNKKERNERIYHYLELVGLNREHANRFVHEFSGGQRQRIGIARALAVEPEFLVLDEPISALDVSIQAQIVNLLIDLQKRMGLTYLFVAHDLSMVKHISDRVAVLYLGTLVELTTSEELYANPQPRIHEHCCQQFRFQIQRSSRKEMLKRFVLKVKCQVLSIPRQDVSSREDVNAQCQSADRRCQSFVILAEVISLPVIFAIHQMDVRQENAYDTE